MSIFRKTWCALFSWNTHFEIRTSALLLTNWLWFYNYEAAFIFLISSHICFSPLSSFFSYNFVAFSGCPALSGVNPNLKSTITISLSKFLQQSWSGLEVISIYFLWGIVCRKEKNLKLDLNKANKYRNQLN